MSPSPTPFVNFDFSLIDWKVLLAAVAIIVTVGLAYYFQWWRNRKRLSYEILLNVPVVSAEEEIRDQVEIRYKGQPVKDVRLIVIKLINDGYQPIKKDDFQSSVKFVFTGATILSAERVKLFPENLDVETGYFPTRVEIHPTLFNRKEYIQFKVLLTDYMGMKVDARIVGVSQITKVKVGSLFRIFIMGFAAVQFGWLAVISFRSTGFYFSLGVVMFSLLFLIWINHLFNRMD